MGKYIDSEKLKTEIKREIESSSKSVRPGKSDYRSVFCRGKIMALYTIKSLIDSLQEEQPKPSNNLVDIDAVREDFITEVYRVLDADPTNDRANAIINAFDSLPTVSQEQPEVDLENYLENYFKEWHIEEEIGLTKPDGWSCIVDDLKDIARHFAEWGAIHLNARKV